MVEHKAHTLESWPHTKEERAKLFNRYDPDGNNLLSLKNLWQMCDEEKIFVEMGPKSAIMRAYKKADEKGSDKYEGLITRKEFVYFLRYIKHYEHLWNEFALIDTSDDKKVELDEFKKGVGVLGLTMDDEKAEATFKQIDKNG